MDDESVNPTKNGDKSKEPAAAAPCKAVSDQLIGLYLQNQAWLKGLAINIAWITKHSGAGMPNHGAQMQAREKWFQTLPKKDRAKYYDIASGVAFGVCMGLSAMLKLDTGPQGPRVWRPGDPLPGI